MSKLGAAAMRAFTQESLFMTHFTHQGNGRTRVAFGAAFPGKIVSINLADLGKPLLCQKDAFLCAVIGTRIAGAFHKKIGTGLFGGEGFVLQKLEGDGLAFVHAGGTIVEKQLDGEKLRVDIGCLVACEDGIDYSIKRAGNLKSMLFGGAGLFLATLPGRGRVWLQSLPFSRLADRILENASSGDGKQTGEGSLLGGAVGLFQKR